jgi:plastocyanin
MTDRRIVERIAAAHRSEWRAAATVAALVIFMLSGCSSRPADAVSSDTPGTPEPAAVSPPGMGSVSGKAPAAVNGVPSVVILTPKSAKQFAAPAETPVMDQVTLTFTPQVLFVRTGVPSEFRNSDDVLHNVRVREEATKEGVFNVAIPTGGAYQHTFARDGFYDVGCDIHPGMSAQVISTSTPFATMADAAGNYFFDGVEPGAYALTIYYGAEKSERDVEVTGSKTEIEP